MAKIVGIEGMSADALNLELQRGAKFVVYQYCISLVVITFKRASNIFFLKPEDNQVARGLPYSFLSLVVGWWGIPWGPIYTLQALVTNFRGGKDVTGEVVASINAAAQPGAGV